MKKPDGWRKEPARHALASKGIKTRQKNARSTSGKAQPRPLVVATLGTKPTEQAKESAVDKVLSTALDEAGSRDGAIELLEDHEWLDRTAQKIAESQTYDEQERVALKAEIVHAIHKNPSMEV